MSINVTRTDILLKPDATRVLLRPFIPGDSERIERIIARIMSIPEGEVLPAFAEVVTAFSRRHKHLEALCLERFEQLRHFIQADQRHLSDGRRLLIGAYFLAEYSLEAAALFNPSIVLHPDQSDMSDGALRFILSLRATGEGHISSIAFRTGTIDAQNYIELDPTSPYAVEAKQVPNPHYEKRQFTRKLAELGLIGESVQNVVAGFGEVFSLDDLQAILRTHLEACTEPEPTVREDTEVCQAILLLALSNREVCFEPEDALCERVIFPATPSQRNGIEDARFVCFDKGDGTSVYYATFTAYDGRVIMPQLIQTSDFLNFQFATLNGAAVENKGMALFPRKINGRYAMLSRQDNESLYLMFSDDIYFWHERQLLVRPQLSWELVQIGNCGSPIETEAGWLVLSHGVGPMRRYCIGAYLLDRDDPSKVLGRLEQPLLMPNASEREGYVPNVVYTCGALIYNELLIVPYGMSDSAVGFATVPLRQVLQAMS